MYKDRHNYRLTCTGLETETKADKKIIFKFLSPLQLYVILISIFIHIPISI